jgi:NADPH:quinone reductase-like Zn-dependent oxidoreductase
MKKKIFLAVTLIAFDCALNFVFAQPNPPMMKAVVVNESGGPEVLKYQDAPKPEPKDDEILVRVMAAAVNPVDSYVRQGRFGKRNGPMIIGSDIAGVVEKTGASAKKFKSGDAVYCYLSVQRGGAYAQYAIARESETAIKPKNISFEEAAAVPLAGTTAWQALIDSGKIQSGQTVLIHGGSGGVGSFAIQIAKARGAKVIATASTPNQDLLKQLGADVVVDYTKPNWESTMHDVDFALLPVGGDTMKRTYGVMKKGGTIATLISRADPAELEKRGISGAPIFSHPNSAELAEITKLIDAGKLRPIVTQVLPLNEAAKADEQAETHHTQGKIVVKIADEPKT